MTDKEQVIDASRRRLFDWKEMLFYKELFYFFTWRDIKIKYKQATLGVLWAVLQPLLMMMIFTFGLAKALGDPNSTIPYPVFVFSGLIIWTVFSSGLSNASTSMISNAQIIKKIYFPRLIIPVSSILGSLFDFAISFVLFVGILIFYQQSIEWTALWMWPVAIIMTVIATLGPGCLVGALNVKYRDFRYVIPFLIQMLFFLTPIIYPVSKLSDPTLKYILVLSPMYAPVELFRAPMTGTTPDTLMLAMSAGSGLMLLIGGLVYFKSTEDFFADFA